MFVPSADKQVFILSGGEHTPYQSKFSKVEQIMTTKTIQKPASKPVKQDVKLDLDSILKQVWNKGLPNGISNIL